MPEVRCTVNNCEYWGEENHCTADRILISAGPTAGKDRHGRHAGRMSGTPAQVSQDTYCWTFEPRGELLEEQRDFEEEVEAVPVPPLL